MKRAILLALAGLALAASPAQARPRLDLARDATIAQRVWGPIPCPGGISYEWAHDPNPNAYARAFAPCRIRWNIDQWAGVRSDDVLRCTILVHEYGHLTGHGHSNDKRNVMFPSIIRPYWRCRLIYERLTGYTVWAWWGS